VPIQPIRVEPGCAMLTYPLRGEASGMAAYRLDKAARRMCAGAVLILCAFLACFSLSRFQALVRVGRSPPIF
jgi:hypothetical protein